MFFTVTLCVRPAVIGDGTHSPAVCVREKIISLNTALVFKSLALVSIYYFVDLFSRADTISDHCQERYHRPARVADTSIFGISN